MKKIILVFLIILFNISLVSAFFGNSFSILDVSDLGNIDIQINFTNKEDIFCLQNGNCSLENLNVTTLNAINVTEKTVNITGDMTIYGSLLSNGTITAEQLISTDDATIQDDLTVYGNISINVDGQSEDHMCTIWAENNYNAMQRFMEAPNFGMSLNYDATTNFLYIDSYENSYSPKHLTGFDRDNQDTYFYSDVIAGDEVNGQNRNPILSNFGMQDNYVGLIGEGTGEDGMLGGLYNGNDLTNAGLYGDITIDISGSGTFVSVNNLFDASPTWASMGNVDLDTEVNITIDLKSYLPNHASGTWEPFIQYRLSMQYPITTGSFGTYFAGTQVFVSPDGINWATSSPESNWYTDQAGRDQQYPSFWFGTRDSPTAYNTQVRFIKFVLTDIQMSPTYAYNKSVWISEIGFRQRGSEYAPQFVQTAGDDIYGDLDLLDDTKLILNSSAEIYYNSDRLIIDDTDNQYIDFQDNNLTTTGKISTEHLYSTDDVVVQDDLTVLGSSGFGVTANNLYKTQIYSFNDNDNIAAQYIRTDSSLDNTEYYSTPIMKYHYDTQEMYAIYGLGQSIETSLDVAYQLISGENQQESYDGNINIHGKSLTQNIQIDIDTEDSDTLITGTELTQAYTGLKGSGNLYFTGYRYNMQSNLGTDGTTSKTGMSISIGGTADTNTALYLTVDGATSNKALNVNSGDIHLDSDASKLCFGEGQDDCMLETGTGLVLDREVGTDIYPFNITGFSEVNVKGNFSIDFPNSNLKYYEYPFLAGAFYVPTIYSDPTIAFENGLTIYNTVDDLAAITFINNDLTEYAYIGWDTSIIDTELYFTNGFGRVTFNQNVYLDDDAIGLYLGEGQDDLLRETGTGLILDRQVGTDTYPFNITGFSEVNIEGNATIGDGGLENYTEIKNNGEIILHGDARVYKEFIVPAGAIKAPGSKPATEAVLGILETPVWQFSDEILVANQESISFSVKIPEDMDRTIAPILLIGWSAPNYGNVKWGAEYLYRTLNEDVTISAQGSQNITVSSSPTANGFVASSINSFETPDSNDLNIRFKLTRLSASAEDNLTDVVNLEGVVFRYVANKIGGTI